MTHKQVEDYLLSMPNVKLDYPFGKEVAVYKVLVSPKKPVTMNGDGGQGGFDERTSRTSDAVSESRKESTQSSAPSADGEANSVGLQGSTLHGDWKMFALIAENSDPVKISLKCDPLLAETLREKYESVMPGYHLNKKYWNTIVLTGQLPWDEIKGFIRHSYDLVTEQSQKN